MAKYKRRGGKSKILVLIAISLCLFMAGNASATDGTTFPVDDAGIAAYVKVSESIDLHATMKNLLPHIHDIVETNPTYFIVNLTNDDNQITHLYVSADGWVIPYYLGTDNVSKVVRWNITSSQDPTLQSVISMTTLEEAIFKTCATIGVDYETIKSDIKFYDFKHPDARLFDKNNNFDTAGESSYSTGLYSKLNIPFQLTTQLEGIDVSHWQGNIDWPSVYNSGKKFAFAKATEGVGFTDQNFDKNMNEAHAAGMLIGAYHYAKPDLGNNAADEARYFVSVAGKYLKYGYLRPALDLEEGASLGKVALSNWVHEWMDTVKSETGIEPILYVNSNYANNYLDSSVTKYNLWIAHWRCDTGTPPNTGLWTDWDFWQYYSPNYCGQNSVPGISGGVDLDIFNGDMSSLYTFVITGGSDGLIPLTGDIYGNDIDVTGFYNANTAEFTFDGEAVRYSLMADKTIVGNRVAYGSNKLLVSNGFDYPVGKPNGDGYNHVYGWDFLEWTGSVYHPGEDWNGNGGGDTDLGDPVYAISNGEIIAAGNYGSGWGNIILVEHGLPDGSTVWSQYAHLQDMILSSGTVSRGQQIGTIGKGYNNEYSAHLHFEIRKQYQSPNAWVNGWSQSQVLNYYYDPSDFIDSHRQLGSSTPIIGDMYGSGTDTTGIYNTGTAEFTFDGKTVNFGQVNDEPIIGDWDGDGYDEIGLFRSSTSMFYLVTRNWATLPYDVGAADKDIPFSYPEDIPIAGDWDGDGDDDIGGYYPGTFYLYQLNLGSSTATSYVDVPFGQTGDTPITGDWDCDGDDDVGVHREFDPDHGNNPTFYFDLDHTGGQADIDPHPYGNNEDIPVAGCWAGNGCDKIGVYRPSTEEFFLAYNIPPDQACGDMGVTPTSWSPTIEHGHSDSQIVTVSASGGPVEGVTASKVSGPAWLSVSPTNLGDIPSGSSKTFSMTASPPSGTSGDFTYTVRVSNTCGTPSSRDVTGTITVNPVGMVNVYLNPAIVNVGLSSTAPVNIILDEALNGLSGYNMTVSLSDPTVAEIVSVSFPSWATMHTNSALPADSVWIKAADLADQITSGATNVNLATLTLRGDDPGTSDILITVTKMDDDTGLPINPNTIPGEIECGIPCCGIIFPSCPNPATDPDGDGLCEDLNGNGVIDFNDIVVFFNYFDNPSVIPDECYLHFDYNGNGLRDFNDINELFAKV